jgi:hypothetical protein
MKTLSILLLLGTTTAIIIGALFAVTPVMAETSLPEIALSNNTTDLSTDVVSVAPATGLLEADASTNLTTTADLAKSAIAETALEASQADSSLETEANAEPGALMNSAFTADLQKESPSESSAREALVAQNTEIGLENINTLDSFVQSVSGGKASQVAGVFVDGALALSVGQQPAGSPGYISNNLGEVSQFALASEYGSLGLLAHNFLSGKDFFNLSAGQVISLVYGDGQIETYRIKEIRSFEARQPDSNYSDFVDLDNGEKLSASELFHSMYNTNNPLVLQTCIANNGISTWGRVFIIAVPVLS